MNNSFITIIKSNKTLIRGGAFSVFSFTNKGLAFLLLIVLANYITPAEFGKLSLYGTVTQFLGYFVALSTTGFFSISYFQRKGELFKKDFSSITAITVVCTLVLCAILCFNSNTISHYADIPTLFLSIAIITSFFQVFMNLFLDYERVKENILNYGLINCGFAILSFILSIYLVGTLNFGWSGRVYAQLLCTTIFGMIGIIVFAKKGLFTIKFNWKDTKAILLWGIPLIPHEATTWIKQGCDRYIINASHSIEDVGLFSFALTLTSVVIIVGMSFNATNSVSIYKILSSNDTSESKALQLKKLKNNLFCIYVIGFILILLGGTILVNYLLPKYSPSLPFFWITSISGFLQCIYFIYVNYLFYYRKNFRIMNITFFTSVIHLILSLILTRYSLYYTSIIYILSQGIVLFLIRHYSIKELRIKQYASR